MYTVRIMLKRIGFFLNYLCIYQYITKHFTVNEFQIKV